MSPLQAPVGGQIEISGQHLLDTEEVTLTSPSAMTDHFASDVVQWGRMNNAPSEPAPALKDIIAVAAGDYHNIALHANGTVTSWTDPSVYFAPVPPAGMSNVVAIAAGDVHGLALRSNGTVVSWGEGNTVPGGLADVIAIAAGTGHSLALRRDGTVAGWGWNEYGQADVPQGLENVVAISAGHSFSLALRADGTVVGWGEVHRLPPDGLTEIAAISAGGSHGLALGRDGTITGWGNSGNGRTSHPPGLTDVVDVAAGFHHNIALRADGTVHQWGSTSWIVEGVPPELEGVGQISAASKHNVVLLRPEMSPHVTVMPQVATVPPGSRIVLRGHAHGVGHLTYQWKREGEEIPGATDPFLLLEDITGGDLGKYTLQVSNSYGVSESAPAHVSSENIVTLSVDAVDGTVIAEPAAAYYEIGAEVTLTAIPDDGYVFAGWTGDVVSGDNPLVLLLDSNRQLTARFVQADLPELPFVDAILPPQAPPGATIRFTGRHLSGVTRVHVVSSYHYRYLLQSFEEHYEPVAFTAVSDELLEVDLPTDFVIEDRPILFVLESEGGATAVSGPSPDNFIPSRWQVLVFDEPDAQLPGDRVTQSLIYLRSGASFSGDLVGSSNIIFMESGSSFTGSTGPRTAAVLAAGAHFDPASQEEPGPHPVFIVPAVSLSLLEWAFVAGPVPPAFSVSVESEGAGSVTMHPPRPDELYAGETVTLLAQPDEGHAFFGWSGDFNTTENPLVFVVNGNTSVTANFAVPRTLSTDAIGGGVIQHAPAGDVYPDGELVTLTAQAQTGWTFIGWEGDLGGIANPATIVMDADKMIGARFMRPQTIHFAALADRHHQSEPFSLSATANSGLVVALEVISGPAVLEDNQVTLTGTGAVTVRATQAGNDTWLPAAPVDRSFVSGYSLATDAGPGGLVSLSPTGLVFLPGTTVTLTATPQAGYRFLGWDGDLQGTDPVQEIVMAGDRSVSASFIQVWSLAVSATAGGTVSQEPEGEQFDDGESVVLTATAGDGFEFTGWSGSASGDENPLTVIMDSNRSITGNFRDAVPPEIVIASPAGGTTRDERFTLAGTITDNVGVTSATWTWNDEEQGELALGEDGAFTVEDLLLHRGENIIALTALDAAGNENHATVIVTWRPGIHLYIAEPDPVQEGLRLPVPIRLDSEGEVGGMTFLLRYDDTVLADPQVEWSEHLALAFRQANIATAGEVFVTFSLPATTIPGGDQLLAEVSFRARSVPDTLATALDLEVYDASDPNGNAFPYGVIADGGEALVRVRNFLGDNNGNDRLDIGDATIIQRLIAGSLERRPWDVTLNDLNQNTFLDSGDVIRVLRAVAGIDPQPGTPEPAFIVVEEPARASMAVTANALGGEDPDGQERLAFPGARYEVSELDGAVTLQLLLADTETPVSGVSFAVEYDPSALRLRNNHSHRIGSMLPAGTMALWNVEPAQNDYDRQSGRLTFAASHENPWPLRSGTVAELTFDLQPGARLRDAWPVRLTQVEVTGDGFDIRPLAGASTAIAVNLPGSTPFDDWIAARDDIDPDRRDAADDGHGFGLANLLTYALARELGAPERSRLPAVRPVTEGDETYLTLSFRIPSHTRGIRYAVDASGDLRTWQELPLAAMRPISTLDPDGTTHITLHDTQPVRLANARYLRLRIVEESSSP